MRSRGVTARVQTAREPARAALLTYALLLGLPLVVLWPVTHAQFTTWDDLATVAQNANFDPVSWSAVVRYWRQPAMDLYVPLTYTMWAVLASLPSLNPVWFHAANLTLHLLSTVLAYGILRRVLARHWPAVLGALFFALHPVQVEPVAWVSGLKDVLSGSLALLALWCYVRMLAIEDRAKARWWFLLATLAFAFALLAKPGAVVVPLLAVIVSRWAFGRPLSTALWGVAPWFAMALACAVVAVVVQPAPHVTQTPLWTRPLIAGDALVFYVSHVLLPLRLAVDYGRTPHQVLSQWGWIGYVTLIVPLALGVGLWSCRERVPLVWTGALLFCAALVPVLGIVSFDFQRYSTVADHYLYLAMLGPALIVGAVLRRMTHWGGSVACIAMLLVLGAKSRAQTWTWQDSRALYASILEVNPRSFLAHNNLGYELASAGGLADAVPHYLEAIRLFPDYRDAHYNLAWVRDHLGDYKAAIADYREALRVDPAYLKARQNLGAALASDGQLGASLEEMRRVLQQDPDDAIWHANTGAVLARLGRYDEAVREYQEALRLQPGFPRAVQALDSLRQRNER